MRDCMSKRQEEARKRHAEEWFSTYRNPYGVASGITEEQMEEVFVKAAGGNVVPFGSINKYDDAAKAKMEEYEELMKRFRRQRISRTIDNIRRFFRKLFSKS